MVSPETSSALPLTRSEASSLLLLLEKADQELASQDRLSQYKAYPKQAEFHAAGAEYRERMLMAGNQLGKTLAASMETAMHLTGRYPGWWQGKRFERPVRWIAGSESAELTRKGVQRLLLGPPENKTAWGTGAIPKDALIDTSPRQGVPDAVASILVQHVSGGQSSIQLQSYDQGRSKWQAETLDGAWLDEEPPEDVYFEVLTRTNTTMGPLYTTMTPLEGISEVVGRFYPIPPPGCHLTMMTIDDVDHYTPEERAAIIATYPEHERKARTRGIPQLGSGRIFPIDEDEIKVQSFPIPAHWRQGCGIDFGWDHPSAGVRMAHDADSDTLYVIAAHRAKQQTPAMFAATVKPWGDWLPWAWPHDGGQGTGKFGVSGADQEQLAKLYKAQGLNMMPHHATFEDGTNGVEAGVQDIFDRMQTGRFKVFAHLLEWFQEFNTYHRKDGVIVKKADDLMAATRYAYMMRRFFKVKSAPRRPAVPLNAPNPGAWMG